MTDETATTPAVEPRTEAPRTIRGALQAVWDLGDELDSNHVRWVAGQVADKFKVDIRYHNDFSEPPRNRNEETIAELQAEIDRLRATPPADDTLLRRALEAVEAGDRLVAEVVEFLEPTNQYTESREHAVREAVREYVRASEAAPDEAALRAEPEARGLDVTAVQAELDAMYPDDESDVRAHIANIETILEATDVDIKTLRTALAAAHSALHSGEGCYEEGEMHELISTTLFRLRGLDTEAGERGAGG